VHATRRSKKTGRESNETRYYLSSLEPDERTPEQWIDIIRGHWAGVENRLHWRKDALLLEDKTRSRNPNIVGALMLLRNAILPLLLDFAADHNVNAAVETICANRRLAIRLLRQPS
jgi:predicted transposase YbfD/YdcC